MIVWMRMSIFKYRVLSLSFSLSFQMRPFSLSLSFSWYRDSRSNYEIVTSCERLMQKRAAIEHPIRTFSKVHWFKLEKNFKCLLSNRVTWPFTNDQLRKDNDLLPRHLSLCRSSEFEVRRTTSRW